MHRDFMLIQSENDYPKYEILALKTNRLFFKPNNNCMGRGIFAADISQKSDAKMYFEKIMEAGGEWIVEEPIIQSNTLALWNTSSVNTIRYYSFLDDKGNYSVMPHALRTGRKGTVVDNAGSGGILAAVDPESGEVYTDGVDENGIYYKAHPDSGVHYKGWIVPRWEELCRLVEKSHREYLPNHHYVGWDWALTDEGWTLVEANWGQFIVQYADKIGKKKIFLKNIGKKK